METLELLGLITPAFVRVIRDYKKRQISRPDGPTLSEVINFHRQDDVFFYKLEDLSRRLALLNYSLVTYDNQRAPINKDTSAMVDKVTGLFDRLICKEVVEQAIEQLQPSPVEEQLEATESKFPNLHNFRTYLEWTPLKDQRIIDDLEILKKETLIENADELLECLSECHILLKSAISPGEQSSISPNVNQHASRFCRRDFESFSFVRKRSDDLHTLLHRQWQCLCDTKHEELLGSYTNVKLRLKADWMRNGSPPKEFDLVFYGKHCFPQDCKVMLEDAPGLSAHQKEIKQLCQISLPELRGMQLNISAVPVEAPTSLSYGTEYESCLALPWDADTGESHQMTLEDLLKLAAKKELTMRTPERRILGIIVAHSFLHLLNGQWIKDSWDETDISFYPYCSDDKTFFNWRRPYISVCLVPTQATESQEDHLGLHPNPGMLTLGLKLLQLELGHAGSYAVPEVSAPKFIRAMKLLDELKRLNMDKTEFDNVIKSIDRCVRMDTYKDKEGSELAWYIYQQVIEPLEQDLFAMKLNAPTTTPQDFEDLLSGVSFKDAITINDSPGWAGSVPQGNLAPNLVSDHFFKKLKEESEPLMMEGHRKTMDSDKKTFQSQVSIASLDTGINLSHPLLKGKIAEEDCYDFVEGRAGITDLVGHGTHTASLLLKTAPRAKIYGARVFKSREADNDAAQRIADAMKYAIKNWEVDIIAISLALLEKDDGIVKQIQAAYAHEKGVLVFAAASNDSSLNPKRVGFPARHPLVICVYSSKHPEVESEFSPKGELNEKNFSAIGENVEGAWPLDLDDKKETTRCNGTSCATPIVAGVAALILEYSRQKGHPKVKNSEALLKKEVMEEVLFQCMTEKRTDGKYNFVKPWQLLLQSDEKTPKKISDEISHHIENSPEC